MPKVAFMFTGPPTSGKSSQAMFLRETTRGTLIRGREIVPELTPVYEAKRELIPDEVFVPALSATLERELSGVVIFDNIPRTELQALRVSDWANRHGIDLHVVKLTLTEDEALERHTNRMVCPHCNEPYHPRLKPERTAGLCDRDRVPLMKRDGDVAELVRASYREYASFERLIFDTFTKHGSIHAIPSSGTVYETAEILYPAIGGAIFRDREMPEGYFRLRNAAEGLRIKHLFISGMPVFMYGGRALMKDFDILVPNDAIDGIAATLGIAVGTITSSVANTRFIEIAPGVEVVSNLVVTADGQSTPFHFEFLNEEARAIRFMGLECPIMGIEDLILFKAALGRFGADDWGKHKDDLSDIEGLVGVQKVDWDKLKDRADRLQMRERLTMKLAQVNVTAPW